ncbi:MaoC family dehydratase N-terminal domain-containing protein [Roseococcus sp. SDR]|uniref:FAS1-like dehydratase domain-containing protein n=1 Tax=Roseococcus sp. SDR TaxID=2835532 RepID=UPI001BD07169|nr:MaoC family dehydratase N-terminal domain-containing protein [Roseococcus sp. SDR]MBS7790898.1 MaoC family dehydratase N-terminal domain-containing protein [Roseococcus sp. SDR]MBV1846212.1 MaoC family dehydratase N-terminal domain-containing protein [Roseococcus sp. SDR]
MDFVIAIEKVRQDWLGRVRIIEDDVSPSMLRRIAAMLDLDPDAYPRGTVLPPHWVSLFAQESARQGDIGVDGHPEPGVTLPPIPLPRRMGAGRRVTLPGQLRVGDALTKRAEVAAIEPKKARTGTICVLTMRHSYLVGGEVIAVDEFDAIYREAVPPGTPSPVNPGTPAPTDAAWTREAQVSNALVFRYSAVTWNAHRIHYDADYAREAEGYPALVQNGGLTMQLLLDAAVENTPGHRLAGYTARLTRPIYVGARITLAGGALEGGRMRAWVADQDGKLCAEMELDFA